jgi:hypothetical protein
VYVVCGGGDRRGPPTVVSRPAALRRVRRAVVHSRLVPSPPPPSPHPPFVLSPHPRTDANTPGTGNRGWGSVMLNIYLVFFYSFNILYIRRSAQRCPRPRPAHTQARGRGQSFKAIPHTTPSFPIRQEMAGEWMQWNAACAGTAGRTPYYTHTLHTTHYATLTPSVCLHFFSGVSNRQSAPARSGQSPAGRVGGGGRDWDQPRECASPFRPPH